MITVQEFLARADAVSDREAKARERDKELYRELEALCVLTGMTVSRTGDLVWVNGINAEPIMSGPLREVVKTLAEPVPDDSPFGFFRGMHLSFTTPPRLDEDQDQDDQVHIGRKEFALLSELTECLTAYIDALA